MNITPNTSSTDYTVLSANTSVDRAGDDALKLMVQAGGRASSFQLMKECSISTGGYVKLLPELSYLPAIIGNDAQPVFLYQIIEVLDELLDYDRLKEEYPTLSYSQLVGAVSFLRKLSQINSRNVDIDELEDDYDTKDLELLNKLRHALNEKEIARVFPNP